MSLSQRPGTAMAAILVALLLLAGCASPGGDEGPPDTSSTQADDDGGDGGDDDDGDDTDGDEDPAQDTVRTGPVAQYGGPAYGDQGQSEDVELGVWCKTIAVFWGGSEPVPDGVRFTFEEAVPDRAGLEVEGGVCGTRGADRSCLGMTVQANESDIRCSLLVRPGPDFEEGTTISFTGTLECPTEEICDAVAAREVEPGPPLVVETPGGE